VSDATTLPAGFRCITCNEDRAGAPRLKTPAGPVCDACEWRHELRESAGPHDPQWRAEP